MSHHLESLLPFVQKPGRYLGLEVNALRKNRVDCELSFCLAFPDVYEVGMSHLGLFILYGLMNREKKVVAERCFAPWPDMERLMRERGILLSSLESGTPLREFDLVGFSLQYELSFTNVLSMLDLGGIPVRREERREGDPIVCAGGPCAFNPAPMKAFIDVFVIGEGEEVILEILEAVILARRKGKKRKEILESLSTIEGVYCPDFHPPGLRVKKRIVKDLNESYFPEVPPIPLIKAVHDRITIEIARGCTRGCRFCQAGMVWRPIRERDPGVIEKIAENLVTSTGQDEISLLALSAGDYTQIAPVVANLVSRFQDRRIALALPSLRVETLAKELIDQIRRIRKTSFTLAPEAGTQRLRDAINKCNVEEDLLKTVEMVFEAGWRAVKLYFMIGLPTEREGDVHGIADLVMRALERTKKGGQITVSVSTFVPKAHTPFQWEAQIDPVETGEKQRLLKSLLRHRRLEIRWHDSRMSLLEGLFSRGDEELGLLIERAYRKGCRFDGWADLFRYDRWQEAMDELGVDLEKRMGQRDLAENLPWDFIDCGLKKEFLLSERTRAYGKELTPDCRTGGCHDCGVCRKKEIQPVEAVKAKSESFTPISASVDAKDVCRCRLTFTKKGLMKYLSHLEVATILQRALTRARMPLLFSEGFRPHPRISFAYATSVGMESKGEYVDVYLTSDTFGVDDLPAQLNRHLPPGIEILEAKRLPASGPSLAESIESFTYSADLSAEDRIRDELNDKIKDFLSREQFEISIEKKGVLENREVRRLIADIRLKDDGVLEITVYFSPQGMINPADVLVYVLGLPKERVKAIRIVKESTSFKKLTC